ncbi:hypothetical protein AUR67_14300 [Pseudoalteromonas sp. XI10]|uniref:hypothetical protein n=1 Tax=Pseudoalteromonas sp. XI10 TaxID=1766621 RepID=UPI0007338056|nr:hypothetical protein [Pseudoalteromonas sp. XI10]KTG19631.1 hypothetical protein AUR67_14300 [Pseudoalteromonas sp. XI10]
MTTAIVKTLKFAAVDSLWTDIFHNAVETETRKYIYSSNDELFIFSGDHFPILLEQAQLLGIVTEDEYYRFYDLLDKNDVFGCLIIEASTGHHLADEGYIFEWNAGIAHTGSGGKFASDFYYYAKRYKYTSIHGCNIEGALRYAFYWDKCSGEPIRKRIWGRRSFDNTEPVGLEYRKFLEQEINNFFRGAKMDNILRSAMRTSPTPNGAKVSLEEAKNRLQRRKARLSKKKT